MRKVLTLIMVLLAGVVLINTQIWAGDDTAALKQKLQKMADEYAQANIAGDIEKMYSFYADDAISMPNYGPMVKGKQNLIKQETEMRKAGMKIHSFSLNTQDVWSSGDLVCETGTYTISLTMPDADQPVNDNGKYLNVWQKEKDGSLKLKCEIWNTDMNPWQMHEEEEGEGMEEKSGN